MKAIQNLIITLQVHENELTTLPSYNFRQVKSLSRPQLFQSLKKLTKKRNLQLMPIEIIEMGSINVHYVD